MAGLVEKLSAHLHYMFVEKFRPGTPEFGMMVAPIICYWVVAFLYDVLDMLQLPITERYRIVRKQRGRENAITKSHVIGRVLLQHLIQFAVGYIVLYVDPDQCAAKPAKPWLQSCCQFILSMFIMDTYQFWIHRWMHVNTWLYKNFHSHHHRLLIPYAFGALYNHPVEAFILDTIGGVITLYASNMSCEVAAWMFTFATIKTVLDHCGYCFPVNPLHDCFPNTTAYHDVHHDFRFIKKNYSQPFFTHWDILMGSFKSPVGFHLLPGESTSKDKVAQAGSPSGDGSSRKGSENGDDDQGENRKDK